MTIKRRNKLPKRLKERCKKLRIRITMVRNGKRVYKTKKAILKECKKKLKRNKFGMKRRRTGPASMSLVNEEGTRYFPIEMDDEIEDEDEDEVEDANNYNEYTQLNYIKKTGNNITSGDVDLFNLSNLNNLNHLSQGMKAIDIIHDIKNNFQRGVGAVRNFLKGDSNGNIFNMNTFIDIFTTFDSKSEKKVIAAYLRNNHISHGDNRNYQENIGSHNYVVVDGVIQDDKGVKTFINSCHLCRRNYDLPRYYLRNDVLIKTFKVIQTVLFLKEHYANYIVGNTLLEGGLPMANANNPLSKYTKNLLYACGNNINVNNNNFTIYFENSNGYTNYSRQQIHIQNHTAAKNRIETLYTNIQDPNFTAQNSLLHNNLEYFYKFITSKIQDIITGRGGDKNKNRIKIFKESTNILRSGGGVQKVVERAIVVIHKNYHMRDLNIFNILDASSGGNYSYNLTNDCLSVIVNNNNPMLQYGKSFNVYPMITQIDNNNIFGIEINDAHFLYSLTKQNDVQTFNLKIYLKTRVNGFDNTDTLTAYEYNLPFAPNNSDYEAVSKFVTIKSTTFEKFENNVMKYITHISNDIQDNQGNSNVNQVPYQVIDNKNAFFIQIYPDCHTGAYNNPNDERPWQISNRCILKLRSTFSVIVRYIDTNNRLHYIVLSSVLPNNPIVKEYVRLFELCTPSYYVESWGPLFNTYTKTEIPPIDTEKILLSLMNYKRIADVLQYYGLREQLDTEGNKNGLLITKDQSAFLQYFHIKYKLNGNQGPDNRIKILLDVPNKKYYFYSSFGKKRKNVINNLVKKFEELTNFPLVEYEFYKEGDLVKARQRINSLIVSIKDNQEAIDVVNRIFRLTGIKPTTKKYIREMEIHNKRTKQLTEERNKENIMKVIKFLQKREKQKRKREEQELKQRQFLRNFNPNTGRGINEVVNQFNQNNLLQAGYAYGKTKKKRKKRKTKKKVKKKTKKKVKKKRKKKVKRRFLYNPNNPKKSFDVYIDKNPKDTISIKYTTVKDVRNTIRKLERLYKTNKYPHTRIWKVGMILKVRLEAIVKNTGKKKEHFRHAKNYFHFLGQRTKKKGDARKKMVFKFNKTYRKVS